MGDSDFLKLLGQLASLTHQQRSQVRSALDVLPRPSVTAIASVIPGPNACRHCQAAGEQLRPWGHSHGLARMRCHACGKTSNALTDTPLAHLRKREQWLRYALEQQSTLGQKFVDGGQDFLCKFVLFQPVAKAQDGGLIGQTGKLLKLGKLAQQRCVEERLFHAWVRQGSNRA